MRRFVRNRTHSLRLWGLLALFILAQPLVAHAQLRIVSYNTTGAPGTGMDIVLRSIGEEQRNGIAKPIDVLLLQEQSTSAGLPNTQAFVTLLNNTIYAGQTFNGLPITYARGNLIGAGDTTQTIVYRTQTVDLIAEASLGNVGSGSSQQPRATLRHRLRPDGYDSTADLYIYNSHYKASQDDPAPGTNANRRNAEATAIRTNSNALGDGTHAIYAGDHNFYDFDAEEPAWGTLTAAGNGQANDPINRVGTWHNNSTFADVHTQSPCALSSGCVGVSGGMDDRFDFQLVTGELLDGEGLSYISGSYHAFGNNGTTFNQSINAVSNSVTFPGVTSHTKTQVLGALFSATDHIPVVADYQLPAILSAIASIVPATLNVGEAFNLDLTVSNAASVLQPVGADELDYSVTTSGDLLGSFFDQVDAALGGANVHQIGLSTATAGLKSGIITIASASQAAQNALVQIPISYQVLATTLAGDYNDDGTVDAADYTVWRNGFGSIYDENDYTVWKNNFGQSLGSGGGAVAVPEPSAAVLVALGACLAILRPATLREWHRKKWNRKR